MKKKQVRARDREAGTGVHHQGRGASSIDSTGGGWGITDAEKQAVEAAKRAQAEGEGQEAALGALLLDPQDNRVSFRARPHLAKMNEAEASGAARDALLHLDSALSILTGDPFNPCEPWLEAELILIRARLCSRAGDEGAAISGFDEAIRRMGGLRAVAHRRPTASALDVERLGEVKLELACEHLAKRRYEEVLKLAADVEASHDALPEELSAARRLRALVAMRTMNTAGLRSCLRGARDGGGVGGNGGDKSGPLVRFPTDEAEYPHRFEGGKSTRNMAKESKENLRHVPKGVQFHFDKRLELMLDEIFIKIKEGYERSVRGGAQREAEEAKAKEGTAELAVAYQFRDSSQETFLLHRSGQFPSHAELADKAAERRLSRETCDVSILLRLIASAEENVTAAVRGTESVSIEKLVNRYNKDGVTALAVAARSDEVFPAGEPSPVRQLLDLGADPQSALDGAIYLTDLTGDFGWTMRLLTALKQQTLLVTPDMFRELVRHTRKCGDTPLLVALVHDKLEIARQLLEWGALVDQRDQVRGEQTCYQMALGKPTKSFVALFDEFRGVN